MPDYVSLANVFIDDILLPDGQMFLGVLGGAGVHAVAGARVWSDSLGLIASIGEDFSPEHLEKLEALGLDLSMLKVEQKKTTRAWQIFQPDEERIEVFRDKSNLVKQISLTSVSLPPQYHNARGYHIHFSGTMDELMTNLETLRAHNPELVLVMEPCVTNTVWRQKEFSEIFRLVDVFSPNTIEGLEITGQSRSEDMVKTFLDWGAARIALRMGENGSLIAENQQDLIKIPAVKRTIVDVTGAGNAYMGGLLVGICEDLSFTDAALRGAVSASFAIEQYGFCAFSSDLIPERDSRLEEASNKLEQASRKDR